MKKLARLVGFNAMHMDRAISMLFDYDFLIL
jgi:hypothetical protein